MGTGSRGVVLEEKNSRGERIKGALRELEIMNKWTCLQRSAGLWLHGVVYCYRVVQTRQAHLPHGHLAFPLPGMLFLQIPTHLSPLIPSGLCSSVSICGKSTLTTLGNIRFIQYGTLVKYVIQESDCCDWHPSSAPSLLRPLYGLVSSCVKCE